MCLNACSVSKRFDFLAFISTYNFDIVAVTEKFLDDSILDCAPVIHLDGIGIDIVGA